MAKQAEEESTMEDVTEDQETTGEAATAGKNAALPNPEEKLLPSGIQKISVPPIVVPPAPLVKLSAADMLHTGNAVEAAQAAPMETELDRNLREIGLKEAYPHQGTAPERVSAEETELNDEDGLPKIRTYAADMGEEMKKRGSTLSTIIGAEKAQVVKESAYVSAPPKRRIRILLAVSTILFVLTGIGAIVTVLFLRNTSDTTAAPAATIIPVNHRVTVSVEDKTPLFETLANIKNNAQLNLGEIDAIDITNNGLPMTAEQILLALGAPPELARNATGILVGIHAFNHVQPFIIIPVSGYDFSFRAMLTWEQTIGDSLGSFFAPQGVTPGTVTTHAPALAFADTVSANLDVRKSQSAWPIMYTFPRQNLLVITTNENTLREILTRLSLQKSSNQ